MYLNSDRSKLKPRDKYIVVQPKEDVRPNTVCVQKFVGAQLRSRRYTVNAADIIKVPVKSPAVHSHTLESEDETEDEETTDQVSETEEEEGEEVAVVEPRRPVVEVPPPVVERRPVRTRKPPGYLKDYEV